MSDDELTILGEEPSQHEARRRRNHRATFDDTTPLENRIQLNLFLETRHPRMTKIPRCGNSFYRGMLADASAELSRNVVTSWQGVMPDLLVIIHPSLATCSLSSSGLSSPRAKSGVRWPALQMSCHKCLKGRDIGKSSPGRRTISSYWLIWREIYITASTTNTQSDIDS
jgi:hypothetical protein